MPLHGIDVSNHNFPLDPVGVPGDFVIMRASEGRGMRDPHFPGYDARVRPSNRLPGAYHFCWVGDATGVENAPQAEAANFAAAVKASLRPGFLLVLDWEPAHGHAARTDWAVDCAAEIRRLTGRAPILYANQSTLDRYDWSRWRREIGTDYWLAGGTAQYAQRTDGYTPGPKPRNPRGWGDPVMWQYTEQGFLPGWGRRLDLNLFSGDAADWRRIADKDTTVTHRNLRGFRFDEATYWWFRAVEDQARAEGLCKVDLDLFQVIGGSPLSGGTHTAGGAIDCWQSGNPARLLQIMRNAGGAAWHRTPAQGFGHHIHVVLKGLSPKPYDYQVRALEAGYNGLGPGGRGGRDDGPRRDVTWPLVSHTEGLRRLRADDPKAEPAPAEPRAIVQELPDFWNPWLAVDAWDNANPDDATLTGLSDEALRERFIAHGFVFYDKGSLHEDMRWTLADFAGSLALENIERDPDRVAWDLLQRVTEAPDPGVTWVELRPVFDAGHAGGGFGVWGEGRTRHSVRAVQAGLNQLSGAELIPEDGVFGAVTRRAVANFQVELRGATAGTPAADGVPGVHDFLHLVRFCSERTGRPHRARFLY